MLGLGGKAVGLDISDSSVEVIALKREGDGFGVVSSGRASLPAGAVVRGAIKKQKEVQEAIARACADAKPEPIKAKEVSRGGIVLAQQTQDAEQYLTYIGKILAVGDLAFTSEKFKGQEHFPKVGDWVGYGKHAGQPMMFRGLRLVTLNDDNILFTVPNPEGFRIYV